MSDLNRIILENQAVIITFGLPVLGAIAGIFATYLNHQSKINEIKLAGRVKLADFRKSEFDELKERISTLLSLIDLQHFQTIKNRGIEIRFDEGEIHELLRTADDISVRIRTRPELALVFEDTFEDVMRHLHVLPESDEPMVGSSGALRKICTEILSTEWEQLESELKRLV